MVLDRIKLKKLLKEKGIKNLDDFNVFMRDISKDIVETLLEEELTDYNLDFYESFCRQLPRSFL